jgi:hypothetical protein
MSVTNTGYLGVKKELNYNGFSHMMLFLIPFYLNLCYRDILCSRDNVVQLPKKQKTVLIPINMIWWISVMPTFHNIPCI